MSKDHNRDEYEEELDDYNPRVHGERRQLIGVADKPTERHVMINNILTAMILAVMGWVGVSINEVKEDISAIREITAVNRADLENLEKQLEEHKNAAHLHWPLNKSTRN